MNSIPAPGQFLTGCGDGLRPALWSCVVFAALAAVTPAAPGRAGAGTHAVGVPVAA